MGLKPYAKGKLEIGIYVAFILAMLLIASMFWMAITGNGICCDPSSLLVRLWRSYS